jgi:hypothetical protein
VVVQPCDIFMCEPSNNIVPPIAKTLTTLESGEHVEIIDGMYSHDIFPLEYGDLYVLICN